MSTRATILITYQGGYTVQLYHHCDGYPEYMGRLLENFCETAFFMQYGTGVDNAMYNLLKMEKHFEFEKKGIKHGDIEYIWYVKLGQDGYDISYTELNPEFAKMDEIEDSDIREEGYEKLFDIILTAKNGKVLYA